MRWLVRIVAILVAVAVLLVGALLLLPGEKLARLAADQIRAQTGREVVFSGEVRFTFWPVLGVETGPVTLANADWAGPEPMFRAEGLTIGIAAAPLLQREIRIERIVADSPVLRLEGAGERANWQFGPGGAPSASPTADPSPAPPAPDAAGQTFTLDRLTLRNARLILVTDGAVALDQSGVDLTARWPDAAGPLDVELSLSRGADPIEARVALADPTGFLEGQVSRLALSARTAGGTVEYDGKASTEGALAGDIAVRMTDTARALSALGQRGVDLPRGLGRAADLAGQLTYTPDGRISLRRLRLDLDGNILTGDADVTLAAKPVVTARLSGGILDLTGLAPQGGDPAPSAGGSGGGAAAPPEAPAGWSDALIDASALALADGTLGLAAQEIRLPGMVLGETRVSLGIERSRAVLQLQPVNVFSGRISGQLVANNRNGLSVGGDLSIEAIELNDALPVLAGIDKLHGEISGRLDFLGVGQSEAAIMRSLSGSGRVSVGKGFFSGFDLEELVRSGGGNGGSTVFDGLTASFTMREGNLFNSDLELMIKGKRVAGEGRVGLGARDLDYTLLPEATHNGRPLRIPVRLTGPWSDPRIRPDLSRALQERIDEEVDKQKDALEAEAKEKLREKLSQELDTEIAPEQDLEEVLKDRLEDEARKGLLKLLGGN
ncbi:AsmA protein [Cribrihabitans marinus]|uniref:AsmA protein n=1 Tax=Cribrihabitans marinus TaxID=1227549 RepID=A0A1H6T2T3_9RHOB|nr:AsmA family protein [Cribrihabitans marinus]GGH22950.1 cell envelope biogenesis protein AsmA [Cribrihabitans marinus]SEI70580.1 AsmA protein [Cribrihabitans marinus]